MGGMVLETNMTEIMTRINEQEKLEKEEVRSPYIRNIISEKRYGGKIFGGNTSVGLKQNCLMSQLLNECSQWWLGE
jgi:hypothetical protein